MKTVAIPLAVAFVVMRTVAFAQGGGDPVAQLRACSLLEREARLQCLDKLSRTVAPPARPEPGGDNWIVSETTSPVDYAPIVTATTPSRGGSNDSGMQLSIHCRGGRTELVVAGPAVSRASGEYAISYRVNEGQPVQLAAASPLSGTGAAFTGDIVRLLQSLPEDGEIAVRLATRTGAAQEGHFLLGGLKMVREKVALACKWPQAVARPRN
jgi:hypothetical protein